MVYVTDIACADVTVRRVAYDLCLVLGNREVPGALHCDQPWTVWLATLGADGVLHCRDGRYFRSQAEAVQAFEGVSYAA